MKKIMNSPENYVTEMLQGLISTRNDLVYIPQAEVITRKYKTNKVGIVSGGGSGHEPAHAGYVGRGMLDAAVAGNVFASPSPDRILRGIKEANQGKGVLLIIKNYSGDVLNFEMAKELAEFEDIQVESVIVRDDVAVPESTYSTGRRGIAGTVFVHKIAGAMAERGSSLEEVKLIAEKTISNLRSIGMAMSPCILPGIGKPGFELNDDEIGIGIGIHGEPGVEKTKILSASALADLLLNKILEDYDYLNSDVAIIVNGLGATPISELYILTNEIQRLLIENNITPNRTFVGNFMTSLEMDGCSISLLKLDEELKMLLNDPCETIALKL